MNGERKGVAIRTPFALFGTAAAALALGMSVALNRGAGVAPLWAWLAAINVATLALYAYDKNAARRGVLRVPEAILHLSAILGGAPTALAARRILRHKTAKQGFQLIFWAIFVIQVATIIVYHTWDRIAA